ncbi:MAG: hypothetical protein CBB87_00490 [Micavibrio sp. TMED27]|nr:isochorismatase [Micavibrio sp.]OUT92952.1 MAG: hypothetical protein CBB87_00490 [Micavibrio sp. TMED27]|tara:strand:+ start:12459 stop:13076 length:618 start_codon:yes stop_codon:yes gene_type:complete
MTLNPQTTALVILDGQNDFLTEGGVLYEAIQAAENGPGLKDRLNSAIAAARSAGAAVINTRITFSEGYPEVTHNGYGIFAAVGETGGFIKGTWGSETAEGLDIENGDTVLEKHGMSAFLNPEFEKMLKERGITTLVLAGLLTDACVECTMRAAYDKGFEVYNLTDATAALDSAKHKATVEGSYPMFAKAVTVDEFTQDLQNRQAA